MESKKNMREVQATETRSKLLESATQLFAEKGYKGVSVREISRKVNLADGIIYHYFPGGKKEIFSEIVETSVKKIIMETGAKNPIEQYINKPLEMALENYYDTCMEVIDNNMDIIKILFRVNEIKEMVTEEMLLRIAEANTDYIEKLLIKKYELGEVKNMDFKVASMTVKDVVIKYAVSKIFGLTECDAHDLSIKERIIKYQVAIWKTN